VLDRARIGTDRWYQKVGDAIVRMRISVVMAEGIFSVKILVSLIASKAITRTPRNLCQSHTSATAPALFFLPLVRLIEYRKK
jgi:hypothetical protein